MQQIDRSGYHLGWLAGNLGLDSDVNLALEAQPRRPQVLLDIHHPACQAMATACMATTACMAVGYAVGTEDMRQRGGEPDCTDYGQDRPLDME